jgi:hypothetical protein
VATGFRHSGYHQANVSQKFKNDGLMMAVMVETCSHLYNKNILLC